MPGKHGADAGLRDFLHRLYNRGYHMFQVPEHPDAVKADNLDVLRNPDIHFSQRLNDEPGQGVGADKQAVEIQLAAVQMGE